VTVKDLVRPIPGARRLWQFYQRSRPTGAFPGSADYWDRRYTEGGTSGAGSYGELGTAKAEFLNAFVHERDLHSVIEFGCGDGHQLSLANYPSYIGLDVSRTAVQMCQRQFANDPTKSFFLYDGSCFTDRFGLFTAELALSLDVIFHLVEDQIFESYMTHLFAAARRFVVIYSTNALIHDNGPHVWHREFTKWVEVNCPQWRLTEVTHGPALADFFVYEHHLCRMQGNYVKLTYP
jgi:hypothetical protein